MANLNNDNFFAQLKVFSFEDLLGKEVKKPVVEEIVKPQEPPKKKQIQFQRPVIQRKKSQEPQISIDIGSLVEAAEVKLNVPKQKSKQSITIEQPTVKIVKEQSSSSLFRLSKTKIVER